MVLEGAKSNIGTIDGSKEAMEGSIRANEGSKETTKGNVGTFNGPNRANKDCL